MRKKKFLALSFIIFIFGITSCGKTTKAKLANNWSVDTFETSQIYVYNDGGVSNTSVVMDETTITQIDNYTPPNTASNISVTSGKVNEHTFTIEKDGTWKESSDFYVNGEQTITERTGTWNFTRKNKEEDFRKNERVMFQVLTEVIVTKHDVNVELDQTINLEYSAGQNVQVYTVSESRNKELTLELVGNASFQEQAFGTFSSARTIKMVLHEN